MATMATFPPIAPSHDLPIWPLPNNFYDEMETEFPYHLFLSASDEYDMDFTVIPEIVANNDNEHTDLSEINLTPLYTPPTPESEPTRTQKPEVTQALSTQETNSVIDNSCLVADGSIKREENEWSSLEEGQQQQQHQQQQQNHQQQQFKVGKKSSNDF